MYKDPWVYAQAVVQGYTGIHTGGCTRINKCALWLAYKDPRVYAFVGVQGSTGCAEIHGSEHCSVQVYNNPRVLDILRNDPCRSVPGNFPAHRVQPDKCLHATIIGVSVSDRVLCLTVLQRLGPGDARGNNVQQDLPVQPPSPTPHPTSRLPFHPHPPPPHPPPTPPRPHDRQTGLTSRPDKPVALVKGPPPAIVSSFPLQLTRDSASASLSDKLLQSRLLKSRN